MLLMVSFTQVPVMCAKVLPPREAATVIDSAIFLELCETDRVAELVVWAMLSTESNRALVIMFGLSSLVFVLLLLEFEFEY